MERIQPPRFVSPSIADGSFTATLLTTIGQDYTVEYSPNLLIWSKLTNFTATVTNTPIEHPDSHTAPTRIYRATSP